MFKFFISMVLSYAGASILMGNRDFIQLGTGILVLLFWVVASIAIHEAGHLVLGLATGYKFSSFQILNFLWYRQNEKIHFKKVATNNFIMGQCLMEPVADERDFKYFWYNFGGCFFNLLVALTALALLLWVPLSDFWEINLVSALGINGFSFLINLIPISFFGNDGYNMYSASKSEEAKRGLHRTLVVNTALQKGKRFRDLAEGLFQVENHADLTNTWTATLLYWEFCRLEDAGDTEEAIAQLKRLDAGALSQNMKASVKINLLYHYLTREGDIEQAEKLYQCKAVKTFLKSGTEGMNRVQSAYAYFAQNNPESAKKYLEQAEKDATTIPYSGMRQMEQEALDELKLLIAG